METWSLAGLQAQGYVEDRATKRAFEQRYLLLFTLGALLIGVPFAAAYLGWRPFAPVQDFHWETFGCVVTGLLLCFAAGMYATHFVPRSRQSGAKMLRYLRSDSDPRCIECLYVDHATSTYFVRLLQWK